LQDIFIELEQLDVVSLKPWVVSHFCEDVYLLLLDVWRPDSAKVGWCSSVLGMLLVQVARHADMRCST
jgi:hypothetical protein